MKLIKIQQYGWIINIFFERKRQTEIQVQIQVQNTGFHWSKFQEQAKINYIVTPYVVKLERKKWCSYHWSQDGNVVETVTSHPSPFGMKNLSLQLPWCCWKMTLRGQPSLEMKKIHILPWTDVSSDWKILSYKGPTPQSGTTPKGSWSRAAHGVSWDLSETFSLCLIGLPSLPFHRCWP